ncbi:MAG: murein hydrolase activator EnvC family protein [Actinomycetota bacterium]
MLARISVAAVLLAAIVAPVTLALGDPDPGPAVPLPSLGSYSWPVHGPVIRRFEPPTGPYGPGHRGIDIAASVGTPVRAAGTGVVAFAGRVAGDLHVSIDHPDGVRTSYAFLDSVEVRAGDAVDRADVVGAVGPGHTGVGTAHLHFGARWGGEYIDPMLLLSRGDLVGLIHLAPIEEGEPEDVP